MRKLCLSFLLILVAACSLSAGVEDDVIALDKAWAKAVVDNNVAEVERIVAPGLIYSHSDGVVDTREAYLKRLKTGTSDYQAIDISKISAKAFGDTAIVNVRAVFRVLADGKQMNNELAYTHVYQKQDGKWRMIAHQSARISQ